MPLLQRSISKKNIREASAPSWRGHWDLNRSGVIPVSVFVGLWTACACGVLFAMVYIYRFQVELVKLGHENSDFFPRKCGEKNEYPKKWSMATSKNPKKCGFWPMKDWNVRWFHRENVWILPGKRLEWSVKNVDVANESLIETWKMVMFANKSREIGSVVIRFYTTAFWEFWCSLDTGWFLDLWVYLGCKPWKLLQCWSLICSKQYLPLKWSWTLLSVSCKVLAWPFW